jgi:hypothetical protein
MSIFSNILNKIFHHQKDDSQSKPSVQATQAPSASQTSASPVGQAASGNSAPQPTPTSEAQKSAPVDVAQVLTELAAKKGGASDWKHSIVDLLKLLDLDSSLEARKELAAELQVSSGSPGSAEQNLALHKAVMDKLAENGGKVPPELRS